MTERTRPKRVVIVDADNPMEEGSLTRFSGHGWLVDHAAGLVAV